MNLFLKIFLENLPPKTEVIAVKAIDPEGKEVHYQLVGGSGLGLFEIHQISGMIRTSTELDYEGNAFYWLTVRAEDSTDDSTKSLASHLHVLIRVLNKNDRAPVFSRPIYFAKILENSVENKVKKKFD